GIPGVERAGAWTSTMVEESGRQFLLQAWDSKNTEGVVDLIVYEGARGKAMWSALDRGEIAISQNMANLRDLGVGDELQVPTAGGSKDFRIAAVVDDYLSERGAAIMSLPTYRRATGDARVESVQLVLEPGASEAAVAKEVRKIFPNRPGLVIASQEEMRQRVTGFFDSLVSVLGGVTVAIFVLVLLVAVTTTAALLSARGKFLGLSSLCGASPDAIRRQLLAEALLIGGGAWLAGAPAGLLAIKPTIAALGIVTGLEPEVVIPVMTLALSLPLVLLASSAAVMIPARRLLPELFNSLRFE
ncbi:MAG TPA: FtsX-like permease family protein, partial [Solirubrobacterales bacterium]